MSKVSIINFKNLEATNLSSENYHPDKLSSIKKLGKFKKIIGDYFSSIKKTYSIFENDSSFINLENVYCGFVEGYSKEEFKSSKKKVEKDDIIISKLRPYLKEIAMINEDSDFFVSTEFFILREKKSSENKRYCLLPFLLSKEVQTILYWSQQGTNHPRFNEDTLTNLHFPEFTQKETSLFKQKMIDAMHAYKDANMIYKSSIKILLEKTIGNKIYKNSMTFSDKLSNIQKEKRIDVEFFQPKYTEFYADLQKIARLENWKILTIGDISERLKYGTSKDLEYFESGVPFLRITDIKNLDFEKESITYISEKDARELKSYSVKNGDLLISRSGTLGLTIPITKEYSNSIFGSYFIRIRPKIKINQEYLAVYLNSVLGMMQVEQASTGAIQTNLTIPAINRIKVLVPSVDLQEEIGKLALDSKIKRKKARGILNELISIVEATI